MQAVKFSTFNLKQSHSPQFLENCTKKYIQGMKLLEYHPTEYKCHNLVKINK